MTVSVTAFRIPVKSWTVCDKLDYINETDNHSKSLEVLPMETAIVSVKPVGCKRPNVNVVIPSKITDRRVNCPINVVLTPRLRVHESPGIGTQAGELFPEGLEVVPEEMAETASTGDLADNQPQNVYELCTKTTVMNLTTDYDESERPATRRVLVEVTEEASTDDTTIAKCTNDVLDKNETTNRKVSTEMLEIPQQLVTQGFLELAAEARIFRVENNQFFLVEEVLPQITDVTRSMCEPVSWMIEGDLGQSVESLCEGTARVPTVRFDVGQLMQWPDINSAGVMICGFMLESEMPLLGSVWCTAEPVSVVTKSEMLTPVFAGGVVATAAPLVVVEAVTLRVSVLPAVGSDIRTGLSVAAGGADQLFLSSVTFWIWLTMALVGRMFVWFRWNICRG